MGAASTTVTMMMIIITVIATVTRCVAGTATTIGTMTCRPALPSAIVCLLVWNGNCECVARCLRDSARKCGLVRTNWNTAYRHHLPTARTW